MRLWTLNEKVRVEDVLRWCVESRRANRLMFISRIDTDRSGRELLDPDVDRTVAAIFASDVLRTPWVTAWPVTELVDHVAKAYIIRLDENVMHRASGAQQMLFKWSGANVPPLPEDCCAYRVGDLLPALVTRTHTRDAWLFHDGEVALDMAREAVWDPEILEYIPATPDFVRVTD